MVSSDLLQAKYSQCSQCFNEIHQRRTEKFYEEKSVIAEITLNKLRNSNGVYCAIDEHMKLLILPNKDYFICSP